MTQEGDADGLVEAQTDSIKEQSGEAGGGRT